MLCFIIKIFLFYTCINLTKRNYLIGDWKKETFSVKVHTYIGISYLSYLYIYEYFYECFSYEINGFNHEVRFNSFRKESDINMRRFYSTQ